MRKMLLVTLVVALFAGIAYGCSGGNALSGEADSDNDGQQSNPVGSISTEEDTPPPPLQFGIDLPNPKWVDGMEWEIINNAGIEYEYDGRSLYLGVEDSVMLTFEAYDADGGRLAYERRYPGELDYHTNSFSQHGYRGVEVAKWFVYLDTPSDTAADEARLMSWKPYNNNTEISGFYQFMRTSEEQAFRPLVLVYDTGGHFKGMGVPGMDGYGRLGDEAEETSWNIVPDVSAVMTEIIEITVAENYEPDENGIRFVGVSSPRVTSDPAELLIVCDVPELTITYSQGTETLMAVNGMIYARLKFAVDEHVAGTITINGKEYPELFFGEYQRNLPVVFDEHFAQPRFTENSFKEYTVALAEIEQ